MKPWLWAVLCAAAINLSSCASAAPPQARTGQAVLPDDGLVRPQPDGTATLKVGQVLEIALMGNPSTGYQWQVVSDGAPALARTTGPSTPPPMDTQPPMPGAPSIARWWFRAERPGKATVKLEYRRPWEKDVPAARTAEYAIVAE